MSAADPAMVPECTITIDFQCESSIALEVLKIASIPTAPEIPIKGDKLTPPALAPAVPGSRIDNIATLKVMPTPSTDQTILVRILVRDRVETDTVAKAFVVLHKGKRVFLTVSISFGMVKGFPCTFSRNLLSSSACFYEKPKTYLHIPNKQNDSLKPNQ